MSGDRADSQVDALVDRLVGPQESVVVPGKDSDGSTVMVDRLTGEVVSHCEGDIVTYRDGRGEHQIFDHGSGFWIAEYNDHFIEYYKYNGKTRVVDRETGEEAIYFDDYVVEFIRCDGGRMLVNRETGKAIDPLFVDEIATMVRRPTGVDAVIVHWLATAKLEGVKFGEWIKAAWDGRNRTVSEMISVRGMNESKRKQILKTNGRRQLYNLNLEIAGVGANIVDNTKWWVVVNPKTGLCRFRPKFATNDFLWDEFEEYANLNALRFGLLAFLQRVEDDDYFEAYDPHETEVEYLSKRCDNQIEWVTSIINNKPSKRIIRQLKWWDQEHENGPCVFRPKIGAKKYIWANGGREVYQDMAQLKIGLVLFQRNIVAGIYNAPRKAAVG